MSNEFHANVEGRIKLLKKERRSVEKAKTNLMLLTANRSLYFCCKNGKRHLCPLCCISHMSHGRSWNSRGMNFLRHRRHRIMSGHSSFTFTPAPFVFIVMMLTDHIKMKHICRLQGVGKEGVRLDLIIGEGKVIVFGSCTKPLFLS